MNTVYQHVKVPGFGCTYPNDFKDEGGTCSFELHRLIRDEVFKRTSATPTLALSIEAGQGMLKTSRKDSFALNFENLIVIPRESNWVLTSSTPILKLMLIDIDDQALDHCAVAFHLKKKDLYDVFAKVQTLTRTIWINELFHRYAFERSIAKQSESAPAQFLESELIKEIYFASNRSSQDVRDIPFFVELPEPLRRALDFIEKNLHEVINADAMAASAVVSRPTLVRLFRSHLKTSPIKYLWNRRLDEADRLLLTGRYAVSEVADLLGFSDSSSFSKSFVERFGVRPSSKVPKSIKNPS